MHHNLTRLIFRSIFFLSLPLVFSFCYEDPVTEKLTIAFNDEGQVEITSSVEFIAARESENPALRQRLNQLRSEFAEERDPWSRRFEGLYLLADRYVRDREEEELARVERIALTTPSVLPQLFADTGVTVGFIHGEGWDEFSLYPGTSTRATPAQRTRVNEGLDQWSRNVSVYFGAVSTMYEYLDQHPGRAFDLLGRVLESVVSDETKKRFGEITDEEKQMVDAVGQAMNPITATLQVAEKEAYSLDELSSLVFDPLPAEVLVKVPGTILEVEGFQKDEESRLRIPPLRLWNSLQSLQENWISPDPLVTLIQAARVEKGPIDLDAFIARQRVVTEVPSATAVRTTVQQQLRRPVSYRVRWQRKLPSERPSRGISTP